MLLNEMLAFEMRDAGLLVGVGDGRIDQMPDAGGLRSFRGNDSLTGLWLGKAVGVFPLPERPKLAGVLQRDAYYLRRVDEADARMSTYCSIWASKPWVWGLFSLILPATSEPSCPRFRQSSGTARLNA
jgi:hypothetical protein